MNLLNAYDTVELLKKDPLVLEDLKKPSSGLPVETPMSLSPDQEKFLLLHPLDFPRNIHARDHLFSYNAEQLVITDRTLLFYDKVARTAQHKTLKTDTDETQIQEARFQSLHEDKDAFRKYLEAFVGAPILDARTCEYGGVKIDQWKFQLTTPVWSRLVCLPTSKFGDKVQMIRRHTHTQQEPGLAFQVDLTEDLTKNYMTKVDTHIMTVRTGSAVDCKITIGTGYAGKDFPGLEKDTSGAGVMYKWYPSTEARVKDATTFIESLGGENGQVHALVEAQAFQSLL